MHVRLRIEHPVRLRAEFEVRGFTALLGRSGAGKTTLLRALAGLLPATGEPWSGLRPNTRPIGYLPQGSALFPHLTVLENAAFGLRGSGRLAAAARLLDDLGIAQLAARFPAQISGGEAHRAALARALARNPRLLLLDEPSAGLDATSRDKVFAQLIKTVADRALPTLAATHDAAIAGLADWMVLLEDGRVIAEGTPRRLFNHPPGEAAARLLGYQNFFTQNGRLCCIRPEDIELAPGRLAIIRALREHGPDLRLNCEAPELLTVLLRNGDKSRFQIGQAVQLHLPEARIKILEV